MCLVPSYLLPLTKLPWRYLSGAPSAYIGIAHWAAWTWGLYIFVSSDQVLYSTLATRLHAHSLNL